MNIDIIYQPLVLDIYGFSGTATNNDYVGTAFQLMDRMWQIVKSNNLTNAGRNIWVYEPGHKVFAGVEIDDTRKNNFGLEQKNITLTKYAYYKHIGPYDRIKKAGQHMTNELKNMGLETGFPYIEIYGHWTDEEGKLETELLMSFK